MLTVEEVLADENFKHFTRKEAEVYIQDLEQFCMMAYQMYTERKNRGLIE